jgi:hypothetical protein
MLLFDEAIFRCTTTQLLACQTRGIRNACEIHLPFPYLTLKHNRLHVLYTCLPTQYCSNNDEVLMLAVLYMRDLELIECAASFLSLVLAHWTKEP